MKKLEIPSVPATASLHNRQAFDAAVRQQLKAITGRLGGRISPLASTASTAEIAAKINEIIATLQD